MGRKKDRSRSREPAQGESVMDRAARLTGGSRPGTASSAASDDDWRGGDCEALDAARQARRERSRSARKKQQGRDGKTERPGRVEEGGGAEESKAPEEPAPNADAELMASLHAPLQRALKQLKDGAEKAVGKPVPFAVETQIGDAITVLRDTCSLYDGAWRSCFTPALRGEAFEGPYEQAFGPLQNEPGSNRAQPRDVGSTYRWLCAVSELTVGAELRALSTASDAKRYLLWDRIKKGCRSLCENAPRHLDAFATQAGRQVAALGGRDGLVTLLVAHAPKVPAVAEACLQASLIEPPKLTGGTPIEFARGADEVLTRGSVNAVSGRTCDIECDDKTTAKHVLIDKVRRLTVIHEPETTGALKRADIALRVLKPALEGVDVGAFSTLVEGKACVPERLIAGTPALVTKMRSAAVTDALRLLRLVDGKCETASTTFEAAATALAAGVEADVRPSTLKVLLDLVRAAKVDAELDTAPATEEAPEGDEGRRAQAIVCVVDGPPLLRPFVDDILAGKLPAKRLKERLEAAKSEAAALGNDGEWDPKRLSTQVERALALELWASRQPALQKFLKEDPAHCLRALCASKHGLLDVAMDLTAPGAALWAPMRAARLAITIMHGSEDFGERDLKVGQALRQVTWPLPSAPCASADEAREAMLKADTLVRGWALRAVGAESQARDGADVAEKLGATAARFDARRGDAQKTASESHAVRRGSQTAAEKATKESDFWRLVRVAKASVAVRTTIVEEEAPPVEAASPAAWLRTETMPVSDEGDAATCMASEGGHVVGSAPIASSIEFEILMWGGGRLGVMEPEAVPGALEAGYFDEAGWGLGSGGVHRKGKVSRAVEGFELKAGDKVTLVHEAAAKVLTWSVNGEAVSKFACRKVSGPVTPCAALLQGSVVRLTYPVVVAKEEAPSTLEGAAKAAHALDRKASSALLELEAQGEQNAQIGACRRVREALALSNYEQAVAAADKVEGLVQFGNWLEDEVSEEAHGPQLALARRAAPEPAFRGYAIRGARCRENSQVIGADAEAPTCVELRWRALCRAQVRVARLEALMLEKFREEETDKELEVLAEPEPEDVGMTPRVDAYVEFSRECGLPRPTVNEAAALAARFGRGWLCLKRACGGDVKSAETALRFPKDPITLARKEPEADLNEPEEEPMEASTDAEHVWGPPEAQVIKAPRSVKRTVMSGLNEVWGALAPFLGDGRSDEALDVDAIVSVVDEARQAVKCAAFDIRNALSAVGEDVARGPTINSKASWRPSGLLDLHRDSSAAARSRGEDERPDDVERDQTPCERIAGLGPTAGLDTNGLLKAVRLCSMKPYAASERDAFGDHVAAVLTGEDADYALDVEGLQQLSDEWDTHGESDALIRALKRAGFVDTEASEASCASVLEAPLVNGEATKVIPFAAFHAALAAERFGCVAAPPALRKLVEARFRPASKAAGIVVGAFLDWLLPRGAALPLQVNGETVRVDARAPLSDARGRIAKQLARDGTLKMNGSVVPKSGDHRPAFLVFTNGELESIEARKAASSRTGFIRRPPPRTKEAMDHAWNGRDARKLHHWSKLCVAAFLKRRGYEDAMVEAFEERAVDGAMLFGRGRESVASVASLEAWDCRAPEALRKHLIKERLGAEGIADPTARARILNQCGYDLHKRNGDVVEQAHSGVSPKTQERRAVKRAVERLKIAAEETPLEPTFRNTAMHRVREVVGGEDVATVGALRQLAEAWLTKGAPKPRKVPKRRPFRPKRGLVVAPPTPKPAPTPAPRPPDDAQKGVAGLFSFAAARQAFRSYARDPRRGHCDATWRDACRAVAELVDESDDATAAFLAEFTSQLELDLGGEVQRLVVDADELIW